MTGTVQLNGVDIDYLYNRIDGTTKISYYAANGLKSKMNFEENRVYLGSDTYLLRVDQATVMARGNRLDPNVAAANAILVIAGGQYIEAGVSMATLADMDSTNKADGMFVYWDALTGKNKYGKPADPEFHSKSGIPFRLELSDAGVESWVTDVVGFATFNSADSAAGPGTPELGTWMQDRGSFGVKGGKLYSVTDTTGDKITMDAGSNKFKVGATLSGHITGLTSPSTW